MRIISSILLTSLVVFIFASCSKEYSLEGLNGNLPGGTWKFENEGAPYNGNIDSSFIQQGSGSTKVLTIAGKSLNGQQDFLIILRATGSFTTGSYKASLSQSQFKYSSSVKTIFEGDFLTGEFIVEITSLSNNSITGTFSGEANDSTGAATEITLGSFISTIDLTNNGTSQGSTSLGTLGGAGGACGPASLAGTFTQGTALTATNTVQLQVDVTRAGTYTIATNTVNGVNFSKTGVFATIGVQNVTLTGAGTPQNAGAQTFSVTYGSSNCTFDVTFLPGTVPVGDYFPLTGNSTWVYGLEGGSPTDSLSHKVIGYTPTFSGQAYNTIAVEQYPFGGTAEDSLYYRKSAGDYYQFEDLGLEFGFDNPLPGEYIFLKDNIPAGGSWQSPDVTGPIGGIPTSGYIKFTILEKAVPATVDGLTFPDVIKVQGETFLTHDPGVPLFSVENWFAKGVGLIYSSASRSGSSQTFQIGQYQVF